MVKSWIEFLKEEFIENSHSVIDAKMEELNDLISNLSDGNNIMYQWESKENNELVINFLFNDLSIRYELNIKNLEVNKVVGDEIDFTESVDSIDEALDIVEKDIHNILGISESYKGQYDSSIKESDVSPIVDRIKKISEMSIVDNEADIENLIDSLEMSLMSYDEVVVESVIDLTLFNYPDISEDKISDKIVSLGDEIMSRYGTEPIQVIRAFEDLFEELSKFYVMEKRAKSGKTKSGRKVPGKYLTKNRKLMTKEIDEFQGKDDYKKNWDADYKSGQGGKGKRWETKKSASTKAYQKKYKNKKK